MLRTALLAFAALLLAHCTTAPPGPGAHGGAAAAPPAAAAPALPPAEDPGPEIAIERLAEHLRRLEALGFSGAVVVEHRGELVHRQGYGWADREELLLPAGLAETGYLLPAWDEARLAVGYSEGERWGRVHRREWRADGPGWNLRANGGLHTTVDDMRRWLALVRGEGPLPAAAVAAWTAPQAEIEEGFAYGYGWEVAATEAGPMIAHNGGNGVFSADFIWLPEAELFLYLQGNSSLVYAAGLRDPLLGALFDPGFEMPPAIAPAADADPANAAAHAGRYGVVGGAVALRADDTRLIAEISGQAALDAVFGHDGTGGEQRSALGALAMEAIARVRAGREDAFSGLVGEGEDAAERARSLRERLERRGELTTLTLIGTIKNVPGTRFAEQGPWTTFFRADLAGGEPEAWSVLWREDGTYLGTAIGPTSDLPSFTLVPTGDGLYTGVEREAPHRQAAFRFAGACLVVGGLRACRTSAPPGSTDLSGIPPAS